MILEQAFHRNAPLAKGPHLSVIPISATLSALASSSLTHDVGLCFHLALHRRPKVAIMPGWRLVGVPYAWDLGG